LAQERMPCAIPKGVLPVPAHVSAELQRVLSEPPQAGTPFPKTPEEWTEKRWVDYSCHASAPWMSDRLNRRIRDFVTVLGCRFPTVQDAHAPTWAKTTVKALASWRYRLRRYDRPWELDLWNRMARSRRLRDPRASSI